MNRAIPDALVTDYAALIPDLSLPDPGGRHVLGAAIISISNVIVTFNLKDFPAAVLARHGVEAQHPDIFLLSFIASMPLQVLAAAGDCLSRLTQPYVETTKYVRVFRRLGLAGTATFLDAKLCR